MQPMALVAAFVVVLIAPRGREKSFVPHPETSLTKIKIRTSENWRVFVEIFQRPKNYFHYSIDDMKGLQ